MAEQLAVPITYTVYYVRQCL